MRVWFASDGDMLWLRTDQGRSKRGPDWYQNLLAEPRCRVAVDDHEIPARFEPGPDLDADLRRLVELWRAKYGAIWVQDWYVERGRVPVKLRLLGER